MSGGARQTADDGYGPVFFEVFGAEARDAARELRAALTAVGITLPGLGPDPWVRSGSAVPLVALGEVRPEVAAQLAATLRRSAAR